MVKRRKSKKKNFPTKKTLKGIAFVLAIGSSIGFLVYFRAYDYTKASLYTFLADFGFVAENVIVEGCERVDINPIRRYLASLRSSCIFALNIDVLRKSLETVPWVRSAIVQRRLPSTIYIRVAERQPVALWQNQHKLYLIDTEGAVLGSELIEQFSHLPILIGEGVPQVAGVFFSTLARFPSLQQRMISAVWVGKRRWDLFLSEKMCIRLPEGNEEIALQLLETLQKEESLFGRPFLCVDLRFPGKVIMRPKKGASSYAKVPPTS
ncbi:MAG: FtsQ-type POTRA domain-containing protein [Holosporales bacterium]|jgi:cell division protein FtsQ|nr:FtsQ-type POTRA domain-containing protein [Holosporales bacterium]